METYLVGMMDSGEWKWLVVVAVGILIVVATLLVSLLRGITWPALLAIAIGSALAAAPIVLPTVLPIQPHKVTVRAEGVNSAPLATANLAAVNQMTIAVTEIKLALESLQPILATIAERPAGTDAEAADSAAANALAANIEAFGRQIEVVEEAANAAAKSLEAADAELKKLKPAETK